MTKYQLDHFRDKVKRQFNPMIDEQELLVKQFKTEATDKAVSKLSKKIQSIKCLILISTQHPRIKTRRILHHFRNVMITKSLLIKLVAII